MTRLTLYLWYLHLSVSFRRMSTCEARAVRLPGVPTQLLNRYSHSIESIHVSCLCHEFSLLFTSLCYWVQRTTVAWMLISDHWFSHVSITLVVIYVVIYSVCFHRILMTKMVFLYACLLVFDGTDCDMSYGSLRQWDWTGSLNLNRRTFSSFLETKRCWIAVVFASCGLPTMDASARSRVDLVLLARV